ncbi:MAG: TIGR02281 family clan AA aspartic protease [Hyphomicrobiales bacterium]|nr:MAG: TIGR02281 family clan AA aspartic protease [Hyphomicrobiales bacterium]
MLSPGSRQAISMAGGWLLSGVVVAGSIVYSVELKDAAKTLFGIRTPSPSVSVAQAPRSTGSTTVELKAGAQGHYFAPVEVNGRLIDVMVDTGATMVALTHEDARRAGLHLRASDFTQIVQTANGAARYAPVMLDKVSIGNITVRDVAAAVAEPGRLHMTLLGMSFLGRLQRVDMRPGLMTLKD